ncbi:cytochrome P450-dit2 [Tilletia horrida]|nr:cytochrome P450-dit2 [Tilletia horrida]
MLADMPLLRAFIYETLRLFPPIPQLVNRRCEDGRVLWLPVAPADRSDSGGAGSGMVPVSIPAGTYVGWSAYALHRSRFNTSWSSFGDDTTLSTHGLGKGSEVATAFLPERWGSTTVEIEATARRARDRGELMTFHAGARACLGQKFAMTELMIVVVHMLAAFEIRPQTDRDGTEAEVTMTPGGLLRPLQVPVELVVLA